MAFRRAMAHRPRNFFKIPLLSGFRPPLSAPMRESFFPPGGAARLKLGSARRSDPTLVSHSRGFASIRGHHPTSASCSAREISLCVASLAPARLIRRFPNLLLLRSCLWQSISTFPRSRFALRAAFGRVGSHSSRNVSPFGLLMQPTAQPPCCLVPGQRPLARVPVSSPPSVPQRPCESPSSRQAALRA
jgi:hypothetical protein